MIYSLAIIKSSIYKERFAKPSAYAIGKFEIRLKSQDLWTDICLFPIPPPIKIVTLNPSRVVLCLKK